MMRILKALTVMAGMVLALPAQAADFTYAGTVAVPASGTIGPASVFPITFNVSGLTTVADLNITISGLTHSKSDDLVMALVSPSLTAILFMDNAGGIANWSNSTITFDQDTLNGAINSFAIPYGGNNGIIPSGTYLPSVYGLGNLLGLVLDGTDLSTFNGEAANGTWSLYIGDNGLLGTGQITGATLSISSPTQPVPEPASWAMLIAGFGLLGGHLRRRATTGGLPIRAAAALF